MATSFATQIPVILHVLQKLRPKTVLDVGKGFGKYGFLIHEYCGIDYGVRPKPELTLLQQSSVAVDGVDVNQDYAFPHLPQFYRQMYWGRIEELCEGLPHYDVVLMVDVIEHIDKQKAMAVLRALIDRGSVMVIATPRRFFEQHLFESEAEEHVSFWTPKDFSREFCCLYQNVRLGRVYVVSRSPLAIPGFGSSPLQRIRRIARAVVNEL
jgi:SAM-dependent methyltransferase